MKNMNKLTNYFSLFLLLGFLLILPQSAFAKDARMSFESSEKAVASLREAMESFNFGQIGKILNLKYDLKNIDESYERERVEKSLTLMKQKYSLKDAGKGIYHLILGNDAFVFPVPLIKEGSKWFFDGPAGEEVMIIRMIGENELNAISVCEAYVLAQSLYVTKDWDNDGIMHYAAKLGSSKGKKDGLYWPAYGVKGEEESPFGPFLSDNYNRGEGIQPKPYHGYYFKILTSQGADAPGGAFDYMINGYMQAGFALVAFPSDYGVTGVMTFIVSRQGDVYEKDLGKDTVRIAKEIKNYNPDKTWRIVEDEGLPAK